MHYKVMINEFEGPLDLLLHLIKENNIDIYEIKIDEITKQYLDYIKAMKEMNLSVASEYLVMASELIEMKSKMLLPKQEEENDEYEEDPKEILIERLLAYKQYKEMTSEFKELELSRKLVFTKEAENINYYVKEEEKTDDLGIDDLINAFNEMLKRKELDKPLATKITKKEISIPERVIRIRHLLKEKKKVNFIELFDVETKEEVIVNFLSILEMARKNEILIEQDNNFKNILISLREGV